MPYGRHFKCYVNLHTTETKIRHIMRDFPVTTCRDFLFGSASELPYKKAALSTAVNAKLMGNHAAYARDSD